MPQDLSHQQTISKRIEFPAGHRLPNYSGACANLHGHTFAVEVTLGIDYLNDDGFVVDLTEVNSFLKNWIDVNWDHAFLVSRRDDDVVAFLKAHNFKWYVMEDYPTIENMARCLFAAVDGRWMGVTVHKVVVWESPTSYTVYTAAREGFLKGV